MPPSFSPSSSRASPALSFPGLAMKAGAQLLGAEKPRRSRGLSRAQINEEGEAERGRRLSWSHGDPGWSRGRWENARCRSREERLLGGGGAARGVGGMLTQGPQGLPRELEAVGQEGGRERTGWGDRQSQFGGQLQEILSGEGSFWRVRVELG